MRYDEPMMEIALAQCKRFVVADIETTGFMRNKGGEVIEIGAVLVDANKRKIVGKYQTFVRPRISSVSKKITELTGISKEDVEDAILPEQALREFSSFAGNLPIVFHNASFDWDRFLDPMLREIGITKKNAIIDTLSIAKVNLKCEKKTLSGLVTYFGGNMENAHRALDDAKYTAGVALKLKEIVAQKPEVKSAALLTPPKSVLFPDFELQSVKCWKKEGAGKGQRRVYVNTSVGTFYYDVNRREWYVKTLITDADVPFDVVEKKFMSFVKLNSMQEVTLYFEKIA